jgi:hypothetical protein
VLLEVLLGKLYLIIVTVLIVFVILVEIGVVFFEYKHLWIYLIYKCLFSKTDCLCGLVVRVLGYRSGGPGSIPGTTRKKKE